MKVVCMLITYICIGRAQNSGSKDKEDAFLMQYGYLPSMEKYGKYITDDMRRMAIMDFQRMSGVTMSGDFDDKTNEMMAAKRCGMTDKVPLSDDPRAPAQYNRVGFQWKSNRLTYKIEDTSRLTRLPPRHIIEMAIRRAFSHWTDVADIQIYPHRRSDTKPNIVIGWGWQDHRDGYPFDGRGGTLAHAFYPEDGRVHFDYEEIWTWRDNRNFDSSDLENSATHEFGHTLGLEHSSEKGAIMAPYYRYMENIKLQPDDIRGVQDLYGVKKRSITTTRSPRIPPTTRSSKIFPVITTPRVQLKRPHECKMKFDDMFKLRDGRFYVSKRDLLYKLNSRHNRIEEGWPKKASQIYERFPSNPYAVTYSYKTERLYVFKDKRVWSYWGRQLEMGFPDQLMFDEGVIPPISAAFTWKDGMIYLVAGKNVYTYLEVQRRIVYHMKLRDMIKDAPFSPDAAVYEFTRGREAFHVFKGAKYYKINPETTLLTQSVHSKAKSWMNCLAQAIRRP